MKAEGGSYLIMDHTIGLKVWISAKDWEGLKAKMAQCELERPPQVVKTEDPESPFKPMEERHTHWSDLDDEIPF